MIAYFYREEGRRLFPRYEESAPWGLPVFGVGLPESCSSRRLQALSRRLYRKGIRRFLAGEGIAPPPPLLPIDPLPLCRAMGGGLALSLLSHLPLRERRVALRGEEAGAEAWSIAEELCPKVGTLFLDFKEGEEVLSHRLRAQYGAATLPLGRGQPPQLAVELSPCAPEDFPALRLWGKPELLGLTLRVAEPIPPEIPALPFLELLWETGRISLEEISPVREAEWP